MTDLPHASGAPRIVFNPCCDANPQHGFRPRSPWHPSIWCLAALLIWAPLAPAQDNPKDDALDQLLQKLDESRPVEATDKDRPAAPKPGEVKPEDKDLDGLLKKLVDTPEEPSPSGKPPKPDADKDREPGAKDKDLKEKDKMLDEHLQQLLGRKKARNRDQQPPGGEDSPLGEAIKKMEEVCRRLVKSDTGEATRKTEGEVIRELDRLLERLRQARASSQQSKSKQKRMSIQQAGNRGNRSGEQPNPDGKGVGNQQPKRPKLNDVLAGGNKDTWGDLPPSLREEMENVFKEDMLPAKRDLIIRYYSSVSKKGRASGQE